MPRWSHLADCWALTKPEVNLLNGITTLAGFWLGRSSQGVDVGWAPLVHAVAGTLLIAISVRVKAGSETAVQRTSSQRFDLRSGSAISVV